MTKIDIGIVCDDCKMAIEVSVYDDVTPAQQDATNNGIKRLTDWYGVYSLHTGEDVGYSSGCDCCGRGTSGNRSELFGLKA